MDWIITGIAIALLAALTAFAGWKSGRPRKDTPRPQWISWQFVTVLSGTALAFALIHAMSLLGFQTGQNTVGQYPTP